MEYKVNINGIDVNAYYSEKAINSLFIPLLKQLSSLHANKQRRILVMLAAPPGAGKSTLVSSLIWQKQPYQRKRFRLLEWTDFIVGRNTSYHIQST